MVLATARRDLLGNGKVLMMEGLNYHIKESIKTTGCSLDKIILEIHIYLESIQKKLGDTYAYT